jgi:membrane peptidoglycan carboxypeptidase
MAFNHKNKIKHTQPRVILDQSVDNDKQMVLAFGSSTKTQRSKKMRAFEVEELYRSQRNNSSFSLSKLRPFVSTGSRIKSSFARNSSGILIVICLIAIVCTWFFVDMWINSPSLNKLANNPPESSILYARDGKTKIFEYFKEEKREFITIDKIPRNMQLAVVALEDENFYGNDQGVPWKNLIGAAQKCITSFGEECRGGSGISQQLVKVMTKQNQSSLDRKARELVTAIKLNQEKTHTDILEAYLNWVPFGRNSYGVQQASRNYFGKSINDVNKSGESTLSPVEACFLASLIQSPSTYEESINNENSDAFRRLIVRKNACLEKLASLTLPINEKGEVGVLIESEEELIRLKQIRVQKAVDVVEKNNIVNGGDVAIIKSTIDDPFPHFREYVTQELNKILGDDQLASGGYRIITTLDPDIQLKSQEIVQKFKPSLQAIYANNAASMIMDGKTGQIVSMVGSVDYNDDSIDGKVNILTTPQQPGSSIKPLVYANAWDSGYSPATTINDISTTWGDFTPRNFSGRFNGPVSMRYALQNSLNIPAVKSILISNKTDKAENGFVSDSNTDLVKSLNGFFNFAERTGLKFPCVASGDGADVCANEEESKIAYRKRCFLSTALGGCEIDPISHTTSVNTLLHEGNLITATPFINIFQNSGNKTVDICESLCPKFYPKKDNVVDKLVARQTANVMTDYDIRAAEFGNLRFNLQLDDKRWRVAAKTGTSNGPKDFWVVGGSPEYSVTVWGGRTDNGDMNSDASAGASISKLWKEQMELIHKGREPVNFSTDGLVKKDLGKGKSELLTPEQVNQFKEKTKFVN